MLRFGAPTLAWETRLDYPHLWGTRRIGPDLARQGGTHTQDWHFAHLFAPRAIVPDSVMPAYPVAVRRRRPTDRGSRRATSWRTSRRSDARASSPGPKARRTRARRATCADDEMATMALSGDDAAQRESGATAPARRGTRDVPAVADLGAGPCASSRPTAPAVTAPPAPATVPVRPRCGRARRTWPSTPTRGRAIVDALWNGAAGTSMPAWRDHAPSDLAALVGRGAQPRRRRARRSRRSRRSELDARGARVRGQLRAVPRHRGRRTRHGGARSCASRRRISARSVRAFGVAMRAIAIGVEGTQMAPWTDRLSDARTSGRRPLRAQLVSRRRRSRRRRPMIADVIVVLSALLSVAFVVAWLAAARTCGLGSSGPSTASRNRYERYDRDRSRADRFAREPFPHDAARRQPASGLISAALVCAVIGVITVAATVIHERGGASAAPTGMPEIATEDYGRRSDRRDRRTARAGPPGSRDALLGQPLRVRRRATSGRAPSPAR